MIDYINKLTRRRTSSGTKRNRVAAAAKEAKRLAAEAVKIQKAKSAKARRAAYKKILQIVGGLGALGSAGLAYHYKDDLKENFKNFKESFKKPNFVLQDDNNNKRRSSSRRRSSVKRRKAEFRTKRKATRAANIAKKIATDLADDARFLTREAKIKKWRAARQNAETAAAANAQKAATAATAALSSFRIASAAQKAANATAQKTANAAAQKAAALNAAAQKAAAQAEKIKDDISSLPRPSHANLAPKKKKKKFAKWDEMAGLV